MAASSAGRCCATVREKPPSKWLSLPINQDAAELIEAQQRRLRARFPETKLSKLALLPRRQVQPDRAAAGDLRRR